MIQLTNYEPIEKIIDTEYGRISYHVWNQKEAERIKAKSKIMFSRGTCALWVSDAGLELKTLNTRYV